MGGNTRWGTRAGRWRRHPRGRRSSWAMLLTAPLVLAGLFATPSSAATGQVQKLAVPAYFYPVGDGLRYWDQIRAGAPAVDLVVATGLNLEGQWADPNYQSQIAATRAAGITVLAYVATTYGARPLDVLKAEIDKAYAWFGVDGIFFDEAVGWPVTCNQYGYYRALHDHVKAKSGPAVTALNHGQILPECYASAADILLSIETDLDSYVNHWRPWGWEQNYPPDKFWHLVHGVDTVEGMREVIELSKARNAGRVFVTTSNAYNTLPPASYWTAQLLAALSVGLPPGFSSTS